MQAAQLTLPTDDEPHPTRAARAARAAERLAPRIGAALPAAVRRALSGEPPSAPSAIAGIAAHMVRVVDALDGETPPDDPAAGALLVERLQAALPPVDGASPGIARVITAAIVGVEPAAPAEPPTPSA